MKAIKSLFGRMFLKMWDMAYKSENEIHDPTDFICLN